MENQILTALLLRYYIKQIYINKTEKEFIKMWLAKQATIMRVSISVSARSASWKSQLTYNKVWPISVKVITNPAAVSASKVRPITSILVATIGDRERGASYFWSKPRQEENQSLAAAHLHCHLVWTACGFHLKTVLVLSGGKKKRVRLVPRSLSAGLIYQRNSPHNHHDVSLISFVVENA